MVGFEISADEAKASAANSTRSHRARGHWYVPAAGATALLDTLQRLLRPGRFHVVETGGKEVGQKELGQPVKLPPMRGRQKYHVTYERTREPVELAGGEAVELSIRRGEPRMEVAPYLKGSPRFEPLGRC